MLMLTNSDFWAILAISVLFIFLRPIAIAAGEFVAGEIRGHVGSTAPDAAVGEKVHDA